MLALWIWDCPWLIKNNCNQTIYVTWPSVMAQISEKICKSRQNINLVWQWAWLWLVRLSVCNLCQSRNKDLTSIHPPVRRGKRGTAGRFIVFVLYKIDSVNGNHYTSQPKLELVWIKQWQLNLNFWRGIKCRSFKLCDVCCVVIWFWSCRNLQQNMILKNIC